MNILLLNAGSSSLKCDLVNSTNFATLAHGQADWAGSPTKYSFQCGGPKPVTDDVDWCRHESAVTRFLDDLTATAAIPDLKQISVVGHRVVHGGEFTSSVEITPEIRSRIDALAELAPLHNPPSLATLAAAENALPDVPHVAVFDTAFHATLPPDAYTYPVPSSWTQGWGIRRYGFHGLSHAYCASRAAEMLTRPIEQLRLVICHLGHGCSATAVAGGKSIDTTMGFTPLDGLMMGTRSGSVDPGIITHIQTRHGLSADEIDAALNRRSGLLGVSGQSADMRMVLDSANSGHEPSRLALAIYTRRIRQAIGSFAVTMNGLDAIVFTAGVGEHSAEIREMVCSGLQCLSLHLDNAANRACRPDADVASRDSPGRILVIATREDITMLSEVIRVVRG